MASSRTQVYAGPYPAWGPWTSVANQIGVATFHVAIEAISNGTVVVGEIRYFDSTNSQVVQGFQDSVDISCGNSVATIDVHLQGSPTGTSCWVDVT